MIVEWLFLAVCLSRRKVAFMFGKTTGQILIILGMLTLNLDDISGQSINDRREKWQSWLNEQTFHSPSYKGSELANSIDRCNAPYDFFVKHEFNKLHESHSISEMRVFRNEKELIRFKCHNLTSFLVVQDQLFRESGNRLFAYDLSKGTQLWQTDLLDYKTMVQMGGWLPRAYLQKSTGNEVHNEKLSDAIIVKRCYGKNGCIQVLDRQSGTPLASKKYVFKVELPK